MKKIKKTIISRRTNLILFTILPISLWVLGSYMLITADIGLWGVIFYLPIFANVIGGWFFDTEEKHISIFSRIPEKYKALGFIIFLIFTMIILPIMAVLIMFDFSTFPVPSFTTDRTDMVTGIVCIVGSALMWIVVLYSINAFRAIRFYAQHYFLSLIAFAATMVLLHRYFITEDMFFAVMSVITLILCAGISSRRHIYGHL